MKKALFYRNSLLIGSGICLCLAVICGFRPWSSISSLPTALAVLLIATSGLFAALGIRELAASFLPIRSRPWYARIGAIFFLLAMLAAISVFGWWAISFLPYGEGIAGAIPRVAIVQLALAAQLLWITILDWPKRDSRPQEAPPAMIIPVFIIPKAFTSQTAQMPTNKPTMIRSGRPNSKRRRRKRRSNRSSTRGTNGNSLVR